MIAVIEAEVGFPRVLGPLLVLARLIAQYLIIKTDLCIHHAR